MATNFLWGSVGSVMNLLTTELNSLANGTISALGPEINNSSGYQMGSLYLHVASATFVDPSFVQVFFIPSKDLAGAAYPGIGGSNFTNYLVDTIYILGSTAAHDEVRFPVMIPPGKFKTALVTGGSCPTLASSGNTLDLYPTPTQY